MSAQALVKLTEDTLTLLQSRLANCEPELRDYYASLVETAQARALAARGRAAAEAAEAYFAQEGAGAYYVA